ncbi:hypothetical protein NLG97_g1628 [Lecanicillium saksenae]|uniref:Uncharacterized protein n=1 Tax=Lecanicillium saksenae TaxID=468837 RepID=A0ACC1R4Z0_9HYPO|nr:hypothetical protein NLG97_g1628 [Lecanicillium saksenae]
MVSRSSNTTAQQYWVNASTRIISQRLSSSDVKIYDLGCTEPLIELSGVEFTALVLADPEDISTNIFFREIKKPVFTFLGSNQIEPEFSSVDELIACYVHQHPASRILRLDGDSDLEELSSNYDLVVLGKNVRLDLVSLIQTESYVITEDSEPPVESLQLKFKQGEITLCFVALDKPDFMFTSQWKRLLHILSASAKNIIWLEHQNSLMQPSMRYVARAAHSENPDLELTDLRVPSRYDAKLLQNAIGYALDPLVESEELQIDDGCLLLPRFGEDTALSSRCSEESVLQSFSDDNLCVSPQLFASSTPDVAFQTNALFEKTSIGNDEIEVEVQTSKLLLRADAVTSCLGTIASAGASGLQPGQQILVLHENRTAHASKLRVNAQLVFPMDVKSLTRAVSLSPQLLQAAYAIYEVARVQPSDTCLIYDAFTPAGEISISLMTSVGSRYVAVVREESERISLIEQYKLSDNAIILNSVDGGRQALKRANGGNLCQLVLKCSEKSAFPQAFDKSLFYNHLVNIGNAAHDSGLNLTYSMLCRDLPRLRDIFTKGFQLLDSPGQTILSGEILSKRPYSQAVEAMQALRNDAGLRSILLYADDSLVKVQSSMDSGRRLLDPKKPYLLSGSFGDAGWVLAQWLFRKGARKLNALVHPLCAPLSPSAVHWLEERDVEVTLYTIYSYDNNSILQWIESTNGEIGGVIQVQPFLDLLKTIHERTISSSLEFFLCVTSVAPYIGVSFEIVHSIANGYMDAFVSWRRLQGFPASSLGVGLVDDLGHITESPSIGSVLHETGISHLYEDESSFQLEQGILSQYSDGEAGGACDHHILSGMRFTSQHEFWSSEPILRMLLESASSSAGECGKRLANAFDGKIAASLSISSTDINIGLPLSSYGMDSLAAVDFRKWFSQELNVNLALFEILGSSTIRAVIVRVSQVFSAQDEDKPKRSPEAKPTKPILEDPKTGLGFTLDYDSYLYGPEEMDRLLENFMTFINSAVRDFRQPIEELDMCGPKELQFLREVCWTEEESSVDWMGRSLMDRWSEVVGRQPASIAIRTSDNQAVTLHELDARAKNTAHLLQASGVKPGDRVGVLSHPSIDVMASMLGIALIRCVYVPLDPTAAQELEPLIAHLRQSTNAKYLPVAEVAPSGSNIIFQQDAPEQPDDICYIVFTSGSTATKEARQDVDELASYIRDAGTTTVYMTPTQLAMVLENCSDILKQCHCLWAVSLIGEHLPPRLVTATYDLGLPLLTVFNEYGPSESTSQNTLYKVPFPTANQTYVDIGRAIPNSSTYVLNSRGRPVPVGVSGELCIGGPQVSLGYLGRSSDAFLQNKFLSGNFGKNNWDRLYRTGDMASFRVNGNISLQGRISGDKQVKLRGHRLDLEEIEMEIRRISSGCPILNIISGVLVLARTLHQAAEGDMTDDRSEIQNIASKLHLELTKTLNKYMIPAYYQPLTAFPMTVSGKIDRVGLTSMALDPVYHVEKPSKQTEQSQEVTEPQITGPLDMIKNLFASILKLPAQKALRYTDNFFELGGQSVLALRLRFGLESSAVKSSVARPHSDAEVSWDSEVALPHDHRYLPNSTRRDDKFNTQKNILILGADGYIGYYMLKFLLALNRDAKIYLLGLGDRFNLGDLFAAFTEHQMFDSQVSQMDVLTRTEIVQGAMGKENFGLAKDDFVKLGRSVNAIYHTGGFVSLLATYRELHPRNVQSVFDMIEFASYGCGAAPTTLHYISTWSIVYVQAWNSTTLSGDQVWLDEQSVATFRPPATNDHGYFKTRWVSEMLIEEAGKRGFPTTIYRCPAHTAPTAAQCATPSDNFTINMCVRMAETGLILRTPKREDNLESAMGMIPIDYLADTLVRLADVEEVATPIGETLRLQITNPNSLAYSKVPELVEQGGRVTGKMFDLDEWFDAITGLSSENINLELSMYKEYLDKGHNMFTINDNKTRPLLAKIASQPGRLQCDAVDLAYLRNLFRQERGRK